MTKENEFFILYERKIENNECLNENNIIILSNFLRFHCITLMINIISNVDLRNEGKIYNNVYYHSDY